MIPSVSAYQSKYPFDPVVTLMTQVFVPLTLTRSIERTQSPFVEQVVASMVIPLWETCVIVYFGIESARTRKTCVILSGEKSETAFGSFVTGQVEPSLAKHTPECRATFWF